jgi:hypothetical protein
MTSAADANGAFDVTSDGTPRVHACGHAGWVVISPAPSFESFACDSTVSFPPPHRCFARMTNDVRHGPTCNFASAAVGILAFATIFTGLFVICRRRMNHEQSAQTTVEVSNQHQRNSHSRHPETALYAVIMRADTHLDITTASL